ncbi:MAG: ATP-binding protein [Lachnospiraceae bacterium]|nr:ATP-binding protein [Lachnospiraceae bacterium]
MIGREKETLELEELYNRDKAELVAIYGRRRVGKTYLVDETFKGRITFRHAGLSPMELSEQYRERPMKQQLRAFYYSLITQGMKKSHCPEDWLEAFFLLEMHLQQIDDGSRQLVFFDELPWMDTPKSGFVTGLEAFWNGWACHRNVMVIVAGSATSWIQDKLIDNHGGLYGRVTYEIKLEPFTLRECESLFMNRGVRLSRYDIVQSYMIFGGIPYYLNYFQRGKSLARIVDEMFFMKGARLVKEFDRLFSSIFSNPDMMKAIVKALSARSMGCTRKEISGQTGYSEGGSLTKALNALIASDFVMRYVPFGCGKREEHYKLVDSFCIFYLRFVDDYSALPDTFWQQNTASQSINAWRGYLFENVCFNHIEQIKSSLGISGVSTTHSAWTKKTGEGGGTQIDLIISRKDNVVNMCEIKFYGELFAVDKNYDLLLRHRRNLLSEEISPKSVVHATLITTYGIKNNEYRWSFDNVITMDDLFDN